MSEHASELLSRLGGDLSLRLIVTLRHFVWQGAAVGGLVAILARLLRNASASMHHAFYGVALPCLPICVVVTIGGPDFGIPEGLPDNFEQPHRVEYLGAQRDAFTVLSVSDPLTDRQFDERVRRKPLKGATKDGDPKPPAPPDLNALNRKQRNPIAPELLAAADTIRRLNECPVDETSEELRFAIRLLVQSTDTEAANSLALQLANHQVADGINNVRFVGFQILASRDRESTLKFLQSIVDRLPENERQRAMELHRAVTRRVVAPPADDNRPTSKPAPTVPDKTRVLVAMAFGEPIYVDQLEPGKTLARNQSASQRQAHRGRRLLELISRLATNDYRRREKLEVTAEMKKSLWESVMRAPMPPNRGLFCEEERRLMSFAWQHASLMDWVLTKSLYGRYGGRVGMGSLGLWLAADGRNQLIKDYQKSGEIRIEDAEIEKALWKEATKPNFADAYPKGDHLKRLLAHPPHLRHSR